MEDSREVEAMRKMFVGGLNRETADDVFFEYFGQYGNMVDKVIIKDPQTKQSRGFGFVTYDHSDCVETVFQSRPHILDGKTLDVKRAMPRDYNTSTAHAKVSKLFIGGVSPDLTPEELQQYIESRHPTSIGTVDKIDFLKDRESNQNKGFGFLECSDFDFADRLTISENSFTIKGKSMSLKKAEPKASEGGAGGPIRGGRGRGMRGGRGGRGDSRGRGGGRGGGGRGSFNNYGSGFGQQENKSYNNDYSTGYPSYGQTSSGNGGGYDSYNQSGYQQQQGFGGQQGNGYGQQGNGYSNQGSYGTEQSNYAAYGGNQGATRGGWSGGNNRYTPY